MWDDEDGRVVCRQLGFPGLDERLRDLPIGQQSTKSATRFNCDRSDSTLSECRHVSSDMMCGSDKGAGVTCSGVITDVRLVSEPSQPNSGRVQVQINGSITWIDVCENGWDEDDGGVVCRQLGFPGLAQHLRGLPIAGQQSMESVRNFRCQGSESTLSECEYQIEDMCGSDKGAGVTCSVITDVRLVGPMRPLSGRVQVQMNDSTWIDVCDDMWDDEDGRVVCRQLGFQGLSERVTRLDIGERSTASVRNFRCQGSESSLSECWHQLRDNMICDSNRGAAGVTCSAFPTTKPPTEATTAVRLTAEITTKGATSQEPERTTLSIAGTTETDEMGGTTARESVPSAQTTGESVQNSPVTIGTRTDETTNPELTRSPNERDGTTIISTAGDGGSDARGGSNPGAYIGLALGCVLFVVCASIIVVCLLKRHKRQDKPTVPAAFQSSAGFQQHSAVYDNSQGSNHLKMRELGNSQAEKAAPKPADDSAEYAYCAVEGRNLEVEAGYVAPNPSPVKTPQEHPVSSKQKPSNELAGKIANPCYLELDGKIAPDDKAPTSGPESDDAYYFKLQPDSPKPVTTDQVAGGTDYFTVEEGGDLVDNGQYTTGVVGEKATPEPPGNPDDVDDHYYSYAKPDTTKQSDPPEDDVYTYADAPIDSTNNLPPNTDYFMIEEGGNSMGSPQQPATESEYAYADPTQLREESPDETEGWVENIVYAAGPLK
ncbi:uncharacterized protein LOC119729290 [Patiria miniata]|uniref:SRCR domain-containing protein n=1 Tax=Patiria miniata TaxID=46514 RepID=A0A914A380_PATMI|nr:uncharacterized protein LOC119729290 [Patiria miniata]